MWPSWDATLFRAIHHGWHHAWLDPVMKALTDPGPWKFPLMGLIAALFLLRGRRGAIGLVALALTIAAGDQISAHVLKPIFRRPRPAVTLSDTRPLFGIRNSYSFPSVHATNFFCAAPVASAVFPEATAFWYACATAVSLSRIYVGDHYPIDVTAGALLGLFLGFLGRKAYRRASRTLLPRREPEGVGLKEGAPASISRAGPVEEAPSGGR
jgi:undecaprenyl-diphosphatase